MEEDTPLPLTGGAAHEPTMSDSLKRLVREYETVEPVIKDLTERRKELAEAIAREMHITSDAVGEEATLELWDGRKLHVSRGERWSWDQETLASLEAGPDDSPSALAEFIEARRSVKRDTYASLDPRVQMLLGAALTRGPGTLSIKITDD